MPDVIYMTSSDGVDQTEYCICASVKWGFGCALAKENRASVSVGSPARASGVALADDDALH